MPETELSWGMSTEMIVLVVVLVVLFGGGGFYWRGRGRR